MPRVADQRLLEMPKKYTVSDGKLVLFLEPAEKGWYSITSPLDPGLVTQAKSIEEAFVMAYDAQKALKAARSLLSRRPGGSQGKTGAAGPATPRAKHTVSSRKATAAAKTNGSGKI